MAFTAGAMGIRALALIPLLEMALPFFLFLGIAEVSVGSVLATAASALGVPYSANNCFK